MIDKVIGNLTREGNWWKKTMELELFGRLTPIDIKIMVEDGCEQPTDSQRAMYSAIMEQWESFSNGIMVELYGTYRENRADKGIVDADDPIYPEITTMYGLADMARVAEINIDAPSHTEDNSGFERKEGQLNVCLQFDCTWDVGDEYSVTFININADEIKEGFWDIINH